MSYLRTFSDSFNAKFVVFTFHALRWIESRSGRFAWWHHTLVGKGVNKGADISSSMLIRLGGLAAVVGGALYFSGLILYLPTKYPIDLHGIGNIFGGLWLVLFVVLLVGAMAATLAIAALYARRRDFYGAFGMVVALVAFVGVALIFAGEIRLSGRVEIYGAAELCGLLLGSLGTLALGLVVTIAVRELPWWSGVALVVWGPAVLWLLLDGGRFGWTSQATLLGMPWIMVGFAVFRAAGRKTEPPSNVR